MKIAETGAELVVVSNERNEAIKLNYEFEKELIDTKQLLASAEFLLQNQQAKISELQTEVKAIQTELQIIREELQLYHDTGITVAQEVIPDYRKSPYGSYDLENNPDAVNVRWLQLKNFLEEDSTDSNIYVEDVYMCGEFAETLHNNAEDSGIKAAWVGIEFEEGSMAHALNAFVTTDRGLVFIDNTGVRLGIPVPKHRDCLVTINVGESLSNKLLFTKRGKRPPGEKIVSQVDIYW
ncbi:hypothetical protein ACFLYI_02115 [Chloroflexota bacterium]